MVCLFDSIARLLGRHDLVLLNQGLVLAAHGLDRLQHLLAGRRRKALDQVVLVRDDAAGIDNGLLGFGQHPVGRVALVGDDDLLLEVDGGGAEGERGDAGEERSGLHRGGDVDGDGDGES